MAELIHVEDVARALLFTIENDVLSGPINFATPNVKREGFEIH